MKIMAYYLILVVGLVVCFMTGTNAVRCYQCSSDADADGEDLCGAYRRFDKTKNIAIDCNDEDSHMPGTFCVKEVRQGLRGYVWDGRWRQVIRRCASVASTGVTGVCNWGVYDNGVYWEECYCSDDSCNAAAIISSNFILLVLLFVLPSIYMFT
ncbi:uncharacterized protein LOC107045883 [Diachasma alloeum]|uniref:uncharacterized protein LOC107045883 n=1 Tax=Diachasma alloeum TaxID=454923 RepID=UPI0007382559|nr:uncharacterized protein LOC107045883 [Diachasma alloeum]